MSGGLLLILILAALYAAFGLRFSGKYERLVIYQNGTPVRVSEKRITFILPFVQSTQKLFVDKREVYLPTVKLANFPNSSLVSCKFNYRVHDPMKAAMNSNLQKATELAVQSTLMYIISSSTFEQCLKETYYMERQSIEVVNRQTRAWGVTVSMLTLSDFRLHQEILGAIEGMLSSLTLELTGLLGNALEVKTLTCESIPKSVNESVNESTDNDPLFDQVLSAALKVQAPPAVYETFAKSNLSDTNA